MGCIQMGPKAAVGGMQYLEAPPGAAHVPRSLRAPGAGEHHKQQETTALGCGASPCAQRPPRATAWEFGRLVGLCSSSPYRLTIFLLHSLNPQTKYLFPSPSFS